MDYSKLFGFVGILRESIKILSKNGKLMTVITIHSLVLYTLLFMLNIFSTKPLFKDLRLKGIYLPMISSSGPEFNNLLAGIKEDFQILIGVESIFILASAIISLLFTTATILASAISYCDKTSSIKDLVLRVAISWKRPLITWFYTKVLAIGFYTLFLTSVLISLLLFSDGTLASSIAIVIVLGVVAALVLCYFSIVWVLALVISVIEENCSGIEALGKAGALVKGKRLDGFILNVVLILLPLIITQSFAGITLGQGLATQITVGLFQVNFLCLMNMLQFIAYTVLYFQCKKQHGEEVELQGDVEYSKIYTAPLDEYMP